MRTTIAIDDALLAEARELTGINETTSLVREALTQLIQLESSRRLARMGGTQPNLKSIPRRRSAPDPDYVDVDAI